MEGQLEDKHDDTGPDDIVVDNDDNERKRSKDDSDENDKGDDEGDETCCLTYSNIDFS